MTTEADTIIADLLDLLARGDEPQPRLNNVKAAAMAHLARKTHSFSRPLADINVHYAEDTNDYLTRDPAGDVLVRSERIPLARIESPDQAIILDIPIDNSLMAVLSQANGRTIAEVTVMADVTIRVVEH